MTIVIEYINNKNYVKYYFKLVSLFLVAVLSDKLLYFNLL